MRMSGAPPGWSGSEISHRETWNLMDAFVEEHWSKLQSTPIGTDIDVLRLGNSRTNAVCFRLGERYFPRRSILSPIDQKKRTRIEEQFGLWILFYLLHFYFKQIVHKGLWLDTNVFTSLELLSIIISCIIFQFYKLKKKTITQSNYW